MFHNDNLYLRLHFSIPSSDKEDLACPARTIHLELSLYVVLNYFMFSGVLILNQLILNRLLLFFS